MNIVQASSNIFSRDLLATFSYASLTLRLCCFLCIQRTNIAQITREWSDAPDFAKISYDNIVVEEQQYLNLHKLDAGTLPISALVHFFKIQSQQKGIRVSATVS